MTFAWAWPSISNIKHALQTPPTLKKKRRMGKNLNLRLLPYLPSPSLWKHGWDWLFDRPCWLHDLDFLLLVVAGQASQRQGFALSCLQAGTRHLLALPTPLHTHLPLGGVGGGPFFPFCTLPILPPSIPLMGGVHGILFWELWRWACVLNRHS